MTELKTYREMARTSPAFLAACEKAGVAPTVRQYSRFVNRRGSAWSAHVSLRANNKEEG